MYGSNAIMSTSVAQETLNLSSTMDVQAKQRLLASLQWYHIDFRIVLAGIYLFLKALHS
jgi:hypothetical protein